jgi:hypothetical protein
MDVHLPRPSGGDLSEFRILTVVELIGARDALTELAEEGTLDAQAVQSVFDVLLEGGQPEAP